MNIGFMGMGKLGLPCALAVEMRGHEVIGYDPSPDVKEILDTKKLPYKEIWAQDYLNKSKIEIKSVEEVFKHSDIILFQYKHHMIHNLRELQEYLMKEKILIIPI